VPIANTTLEIQKVVEAAARALKVDESIVAKLASTAVDYFVELYGGRRLYIPLLQHRRLARNEAIRAAIRDKQPPDRIAKTHDVDVSTVQRIRARMTDG
jgi:hypothetical protein